jgi:hypothetical protein
MLIKGSHDGCMSCYGGVLRRCNFSQVVDIKQAASIVLRLTEAIYASVRNQSMLKIGGSSSLLMTFLALARIRS